jgi:hypothetical protein
MIRAGLYPPLRAVASWDGQRILYYCAVCSTTGPSPDHEPGGEACRLLLDDRAAKMMEGW